MADAVQEIAAEGHAEHHDPQLQHHFETVEQQFDASKLGMWIFLVTEVLFFSGLFCAYAVYRRTHPEIFDVGQHFLNVWMGATNTAVLILSSFTMAMGVWCAQRSYRGGLILCLVLTLMGAITFMVIKYFEYAHKIETGKVWGANFNPVPGHEAGAEHGVVPLGEEHAGMPATGQHAVADPAVAEEIAEVEAEHGAATSPETGADASAAAAPIEGSQIKPAAVGPAGVNPLAQEGRPEPLTEAEVYARAKRMKDLQIFMAIYYSMTGLHGIHVLAGIVVITWLLIGAIKGRFDSNYYTPVDLVGLYWHVVDLVWIFLFPLFYLID